MEAKQAGTPGHAGQFDCFATTFKLQFDLQTEIYTANVAEETKAFVTNATFATIKFSIHLHISRKSTNFAADLEESVVSDKHTL